MPPDPTSPPDPATTLARVCASLAASDPASARTILRRDYPFQPIEPEGRKYTELQLMQVFLRDGFIDRYSGARLVNPAVLRLLSLLLPDDFPAHPNWKMGETHIAFWELFPTVDHVVPVARGGADAEPNWVTCSMMRNGAKGHFTLEELGWELLPPGDDAEWDGLTGFLLDFVRGQPDAIEAHVATNAASVRYVRRWVRASEGALR